MYKFKFADIGEGLHEGKVGEINVKLGDVVKEGDTLFSVETDKVTSDIPSPIDGKVLAILIKTGETVHVGDEIFHFDAQGDNDVQENKPKDAKPEKQSVSESGASVVGEVKVSNEVVSFDNLFSQSADDQSNQNQSKPNSSSNDDVKFDINSIQSIGQGEKVDAVIIGAGPGGYTIAEKIAKQGYKVVIIEKTFPGGVCLNVGCIPTKTLLRSSKMMYYTRKLKEFGISSNIKDIAFDWMVINKRKDQVRKRLREGVVSILKMNNVELIKGEAKVIDRYNVKVGKKTFTTKIIVLATGSSPIQLPIPGFDAGVKNNVIIDSSKALDLKKPPKKLVVIGGGVIGLEFAILYKEFGTDVTIIEGQNEPLGPTDEEVRKYALKLLEKSGIKIKTNAKVVEYSSTKGIKFEHNNKDFFVKADKILVSVGRKPNTLNLDKILGIELTKRGAFKVNDKLQTSINNIFAIGDCVGQIMLAHVAYKHAQIVSSVLKGEYASFDLKKVPACVYTHPEISSVGYTEQELKAQKIPYLKSIWQNSFLGRILAEGSDESGFTKILFGPKYGEILGVHIINAHSSDMIAEVALAMELEATVYELANTIHPHPSISEGIYEAALHAVDILEKQKR